MGLFDDVLKDGESLFRNELALDPEFMPKQLPFRENENQVIALRIKPLFQKRNGSNLLIFGPPGVGKTVAVRKVIEELETATEEILPLYINCWQHNSSYKVVLEICRLLGYARTMNKNTNELFEIVLQMLNKSSVVLVFDEIDRASDLDFLYVLLEKVYRKTLILITNYKDTLLSVDERIRSRLAPELQEFKPYSREETNGILEKRKESAFVPGVWEEDAFAMVVDACYGVHDIRRGLLLMREAGNASEQAAAKKIGVAQVAAVRARFDQAATKRVLDDDAQLIISLLLNADGDEKIGALFQRYQEKGAAGSYKTFQRKIEKMAQDKQLLTKKVLGGVDGTTTIVSRYEEKTLDDFE